MTPTSSSTPGPCATRQRESFARKKDRGEAFRAAAYPFA